MGKVIFVALVTVWVGDPELFDKYSSYHVFVTHIGICYSIPLVFSGYHVLTIN